MLGRVLLDDRNRRLDNGGAVAVSRRLAVTAAHVIPAGFTGEVSFGTLDGGFSVDVTQVRRDEELDVAVLTLAADVPYVTGVARASAGERWRVPVPVALDDPHLSGTVTVTSRGYRNSLGHEVQAMQLRVQEEVKDYQAYSGSGVTLPDRGGRVAGILIEQQPERATAAGDARPLAANVLYAVPMTVVAERFGLDIAPGVFRVEEEPPGAYDVLAAAESMHRKLPAVLPPLPDRAAVDAAVPRLRATVEFMWQYAWQPLILLVPQLEMATWWKLFGAYASPVLRDFKGLNPHQRHRAALRVERETVAAPWQLWVVGGGGQPPYPGLTFGSARLGRALAEAVTMPGFDAHHTDPAELARRLSPSVGAYLTLQWHRLHHGQEAADPDLPTLLRVPARRGWLSAHHAFGKFDDGYREEPRGEYGGLPPRERWVGSRVTLYENTWLSSKTFSLRPALAGAALR
ncbi:trypsin-like peptidase domain-containing protein [Micromonospora sp. Llam7]|uniref:serine protease n=1 Tax=Micromonospora tarapacensis TaxID=2835305 RepID=UPI001C832490|nr:serine protease [Micromonospora tarapacensis]MBX7268128.1 trypsin-like peptidase domain-containing protein [Micromonospora tarapacensis]